MLTINYIKLLIFLFISFLFYYQLQAQTAIRKNYKLVVSLNKAPFDSLFLQDYTEGRNILIPGRKLKQFTWEITVPGNIVSNSETMVLLASPYNSISNSKTMIRFVANRSSEKVIIANVGVEEENNYIYGTYADTVVFPEEQLLFKVHRKDTVVVGKLICTDFNLITKDFDSDIAIRAQDPLFSWFQNSNDRNISYDDYLASYIQISKKHPDSRFLITSLASNLTRYKSKDDIRKVYENFSNKHKNTIWAKHIERFLSRNKFPNTSLVAILNGTKQKIIQDTSKYNLIVFTASWCKPCIEEIPLLKTIYKDLSKNILITYISIDNKSGVAAFRKLIQQKGIPWRSLLAFNEVKNIKQKYFIEGIPHSILVYPNQDTKVLDVRRDDDRLILYSIVQSLNKP
jgi:thiol-disulfide isomerase/thioredoxin